MKTPRDKGKVSLARITAPQFELQTLSVQKNGRAAALPMISMSLFQAGCAGVSDSSNCPVPKERDASVAAIPVISL